MTVVRAAAPAAARPPLADAVPEGRRPPSLAAPSVSCLFAPAALKVFFLSDSVRTRVDTVSLRVSRVCLWGLSTFLVYSFQQIEKIGAIISLNIFFSPPLPPSLPGTTAHAKTRNLLCSCPQPFLFVLIFLIYIFRRYVFKFAHLFFATWIPSEVFFIRTW